MSGTDKLGRTAAVEIFWVAGDFCRHELQSSSGASSSSGLRGGDAELTRCQRSAEPERGAGERGVLVGCAGLGREREDGPRVHRTNVKNGFVFSNL